MIPDGSRTGKIMPASNANSHPVVLRMPVWLFIGLLGLAHLAFAVLYDPYGSLRPWIDELCVAAIYTQPLLFGQWIALGTGAFALRAQVTGLFYAILLWSSGIFSESSPDAGDLMSRIVILLMTTACLLIARRWRGWRIARFIDLSKSEDAAFRFGIKSLLVWTAFWAILLLVGRLVWLRFDEPLRPEKWTEIIAMIPVLFLIFAPAALLTLAILSTKVLTPFTAAAAAGLIWPMAIFLVLRLMLLLEPASTSTLRDILPLYIGSALTAVVTVLPLRLAGYRFVNKRSGAVVG